MNQILQLLTSGADFLAPLMLLIITGILVFWAGEKYGKKDEQLEQEKNKTKDADIRAQKVNEQLKKEAEIDKFYDKLDHDLRDFTE